MGVVKRMTLGTFPMEKGESYLQAESRYIPKELHRPGNRKPIVEEATSVDTSRAIHAGRQRIEMPDLSKNPHQVGVATPKEVMVPVRKRNFFAPTDASMSVSNGNGHQKSAAKKYPPRRIVEALQQHPPLRGKNAYLEAKNFDQLQVGMGDKPPSSNTAKTTVKKPGLNVQDVELHRTELKRNVRRRWNMENGECSNTKSPPTFQQSSTSSRLHDNHTIDIRLKVRETLHLERVLESFNNGKW